MGTTTATRGFLALSGATVLSGLIGMVADSVMGATVQQCRTCPACGIDTEQRVHRCGTTTRHLRGFAWFTNDTVNFVATCIGAIIGIGIYAMVTP
jgi:uncharacterized membrane protein